MEIKLKKCLDCKEFSILKELNLCSNCYRKRIIKQRMNYKENYFKHHGLDKCDVILCKICLAPAVNLHHVIYKSQGGTDDPSNLIPLCYACHHSHHTINRPTTEQLKEANEN